MRDAGTAVWSATTSLATTRFPDAQAAADTITAWRDLLETCRRHGWVLLGSGTRVQGLRTSPGTAAVDRAAVALVDRLADLTRPRGRAEPTASRDPAEQGMPGGGGRRAAGRRTVEGPQRTGGPDRGPGGFPEHHAGLGAAGLTDPAVDRRGVAGRSRVHPRT